jgi:hypothetical protein
MNNIQSQVKNIASRGRYGDSTLVHMNPTELSGLAQMGQMTVNPETGLPEAFGLRDAIPIAASIVGGVFGGPVGAGLGSGLATGLLEGDLKKGLLAGLTSYGFGSILQGAGAAAKGAEAAAQATAKATAEEAAKVAAEEAAKAGTEEVAKAATEEVAKTATEEVAKAGTEEVVSQAAKEAGIQAGDVARQFALDNPPTSLLTSAKDAFTPTTGTEGFGKFTSVFDNLASGAAQPAAYIPLGIGGSGLGMIEAQEQYEEDLAEGNRQDLLQREYEAMMRPEPILYSATGGLTQFNEGGDIKPQVISRQKRPYAINTDYMPGINPEVLYFNPATMNPAAMTIMEDGTDVNRTVQAEPMMPDFYDNFSKGGFDVDYKTVPTQTSIDPYQKYTGVAPPAYLQKSAIPSPEINMKPLETMPLPAQDDPLDNIPATYNGIPMSVLAALPFGKEGILEEYVNSGGEIADVRASQNLFNEGGETAIDPLIKEAKAFIMGETEDDSIVQKFVEKYGTDAYLALREEVLQSLIPNAQTEGLIAGKGNGGMDDDLRGNIGGKETIAVSQDEFIVPADVVSMLGDGSSDAGAKELYNMMDRVRTEKYGTKQQAKPIDNSKVLPA